MNVESRKEVKENLKSRAGQVWAEPYAMPTTVARKAPWTQLLDLEPKGPQMFYDRGGRCYAVCMRVLSNGRTKEEMNDEERQLRGQFADKALESLNRALAGGFQTWPSF